MRAAADKIERARVKASNSPGPGSSGELQLLPRDVGGIDVLVELCWEAVAPGLLKLGYESKKSKIHLALHEALVNAWKHGNRRRDDLPIVFRWRFDGDFLFEVEDAGDGFAHQVGTDPCSGPGLLAESGRGLFIIRACSQEVRWEKDGRRIIVRFSPA